MTPSLARDNQRYSRNAYAKPFGKGRVARASRRKFADLADTIFRQDGRILTFFPATLASAFGIHIAIVVALRASKQMVRITAQAIVASMERALALVKRAIVQLIAKAMGVDYFVFQLHHTVAVTKRARPFPTVGEWARGDEVPETFGRGWGVRGARGMILHSIVSLLDLLTPPDGSNRCGGNFIGSLHYTTSEPTGVTTL